MAYRNDDRVFSSRIFLPTGKGCLHCSSTTHYTTGCPFRSNKLSRGQTRLPVDTKRAPPRFPPKSTLNEKPKKSFVSVRILGGDEKSVEDKRNSKMKPYKYVKREDKFVSEKENLNLVISVESNDEKTNSNIKELDEELSNEETENGEQFDDDNESESDNEIDNVDQPEHDDETENEKDEESDGESIKTNCSSDTETGDEEKEKKVQSRGPKCYNCNRFGHISRNCRYHHVPRDFAQASGNQVVKCYNCGRIGHIARNCTRPVANQPVRSRKVPFPTSQFEFLKCFNCGKQGHTSRNCEKPRLNNICYKCQEEGHIQTECPN